MYRYLHLLLLIFSWLNAPLLAEDNKLQSQAVTEYEGIPSAIVNGSVNVITGRYVENCIDFVIPGAKPLVVSRSYCSGDTRPDGQCLGGGWVLNHSQTLKSFQAFIQWNGDYLGRELRAVTLSECSGASMVYSKSADDKSSPLTVDTSLYFCDGMTNCASGNICARTNLKNTVVDYDTGGHGKRASARVFASDGSLRSYSAGGANCTLVLDWEKNADGFSHYYDYCKAGPGKKGLSHIELRSPCGQKISHADIQYNSNNRTIQACDGRRSQIYGDSVINWQGRVTNYVYKKGRVQERKLLHGPFLKNTYDSADKVIQQLAPVGYDEQAIPIYSFNYQRTKLRSVPPRKYEGCTEVRDALGNRTDYHWDCCKRLTAIDSYTVEGELLSREQLVWGEMGSQDTCNLVARSLSDGQGQAIMAKTYHYDVVGNPLEETFWGNLSGQCAAPLVLDHKGQPVDNGCERVTTRRRFSDDAFHLLLEEEQPNGLIQRYTYQSGTDRITGKLTATQDGIHLREFYNYDSNGSLVAQISDDGCGEDHDDLTGVRCRLIKRYTPRTQAPAIGLPAEVSEFFLDLATGEELLLKRVVYEYSSFGQVDSETVYDANGDFQYSNVKHHADGIDPFDPTQVEAKIQRLVEGLPPKYHGEVDYSVDPLGRVTEYSYDLNGNLLSENPSHLDYEIHHQYDQAHRRIRSEKRFLDGTVETLSHRYDYKSQKTADIDKFGNEIQYRYDAQGRLIERLYPSTLNADGEEVQSKEQWLYNAQGQVVRYIDPKGNVTKKAYNARGAVTRVRYPDGTEERFRYSLTGKLEEKWSRSGLRTTLFYDDLGRLIREENYDRSGRLLSSSQSIYEGSCLIANIDAEGNQTLYEYDGAGRKIAEIHPRDAGPAQVTYSEYDAMGRPYKQRRVYEDGETITVHSYDVLGRILEERVEDQDGNLLRWKGIAYDKTGQVCETAEQTATAGIVRSYQIRDDSGRLIKQIDAEGNETRFDYDDSSRNSLGQRISKVTVTDPLGRQTETYHDALGRVRETRVLAHYGALLAHSVTSYDLSGQLAERKDAVLDHNNQQQRWSSVRWEYNSMGQVTRLVQAPGTTLQKDTLTQYDIYGQKSSVLKPDGTVIYYVHDAQGQLQRLWSSDDSVDISYRYDRCGRLLSAADYAQRAVVKRRYDNLGSVLEESIEGLGSTSYSYDALGRCIEQQFPDGSSSSYSYGALDLQGITRYDAQGNKRYEQQYNDYDLSGRCLKARLPGGLGDLDTEWDALGRIRSIRSEHWEEEIPADAYNAVGLLTKAMVTDHQGRLEQTYSYDARYQLQSEQGAFVHHYSSDSLNNRLSCDGAACTTNALNQLTSDATASYVYSDNGNLLRETHADGTHTDYRYDALERLTGVTLADGTSVQMSYDPLHRRIRKVVDGQETLYCYQGQSEVAAVRDGRFVEFRVLGIGLGADIGATVAIELGDSCLVPIHDHRGSVCTLIDMASKEVVESYRYGAFGEERIIPAANTESGNPWRFSSKRKDAETQLIYFGRRYYQPKTARWISADPAGYQDGPNLYAYVKNRPLTHWDEYGLSARDRRRESRRPPLLAKSVEGRRIPQMGSRTGGLFKLVGRELFPGGVIREAIETFGQYLAGDDTSESSFYDAGWVVAYAGDPTLNNGEAHLRCSGIMNTKKSLERMAEVMSENLGGKYVEVYGRESRGLVADILQGGLFDWITGCMRDSACLARSIMKCVEKLALHGPVHSLNLDCHSRGVWIGNGALPMLGQDLTDMMTVRTFGGATMIEKKAAASVKNYTYVFDLVGMFKGLGIFRVLSSRYDVEIVGPGTGLPFLHHGIDSTPYRRILEAFSKPTTLQDKEAL